MIYQYCLVCGSKDFEDLFYVSDCLEMVDKKEMLIECRKCGFIFPKHTHTYQLDRIYPDNYYWQKKEGTSFLRKLLGKIEHIMYELFLYSEIRSFCSVVRNKFVKIADIGCGAGWFLKMLKKAGYKSLTGVEPNQTSVVTNNSSGYELINSDLPLPQMPDQAFDAIILNNVLEHIPNPEYALKEIGRLLKQTGIIVISVPNTNSLQAKLLGKRWNGWDYPRHCWHFTPETAVLFLKKMGFHTMQKNFVNIRTGIAALLLSLLPGINHARTNKATRHELLIYRLLLLILMPCVLLFVLLENVLHRGCIVTIYANKS